MVLTGGQVRSTGSGKAPESSGEVLHMLTSVLTGGGLPGRLPMEECCREATFLGLGVFLYSMG
jgi:hypothetical protein